MSILEQQYVICLFRFHSYATISVADAIFILGGTGDYEYDTDEYERLSKIIARFDDSSRPLWEIAGYLKKGRHYPNAIDHNNKIVIAGSSTSEIWDTKSDGKIDAFSDAKIFDTDLPVSGLGDFALFVVDAGTCPESG